MISIVAAIGKKRELGKDNKLLWDIPEDLKRFREITNGHPIVMGRKTFESIGRVLPNRTNIVITREKDRFLKKVKSFKHFENVCVVASLEEALHEASGKPGSEEIMVIGGGQIFKQALFITDRLYLTIVDQTFDADTFFPEHGMFKKVIAEEKRESSGYRYTFMIVEKEKAETDMKMPVAKD